MAQSSGGNKPLWAPLEPGSQESGNWAFGEENGTGGHLTAVLSPIKIDGSDLLTRYRQRRPIV